MISAFGIKELRQQICSRIGINQVGPDEFAVDIPLSFPDGDECRIYVSKAGDCWVATDEGQAVIRAGYNGDIDVRGKGYADRFGKILDLHGLSDNDGELRTLPTDNPGEAVFALAQASIDIVTLANSPRETERIKQSDFEKVLSRLVKSAISGSGKVTERWVDEDDTERLYPVDVRVDDSRVEQPVFVFGAHTSLSCNHATVSCLHHRNVFRRQFRGVALLRGSTISGPDAKRLRNEMDESFEYPSQIDKFKSYLAEVA